MSYSEFCSLLAGIMPETPLGRIVGIRAETDRKVIKKFSKEERAIHNNWKKRKVKPKNEDAYLFAAAQFEELFKSMAKVGESSE